MEKNVNLSDLYVDDQTISEEILYDVLKPYMRFAKSNHEMILTDAGQKLSVEKKVLVILFAQMALFKLKNSTMKALGPKEIERVSDINGNSVRGALKKLKEKKYISQDAEGRYLISGFNMNQVLQEMKGKVS